MRKLFTAVLAAAAAATLAGSVFAASTTKSTKSKAAAHTTSGQIESYDNAAHKLTLKSGSGSTTFTVADDAKVWVGKDALAVDQLSGRTGSKATVTYTMTGADKTTHTIRLASGTTKTK